MWYLALLAVGIAILFAWFFFKKVTPQPETSVVTDNKENYKAAISAVVNQAKIIAANERLSPADEGGTS
jgi:flagellar basal body-associated protein FliL